MNVNSPVVNAPVSVAGSVAGPAVAKMSTTAVAESSSTIVTVPEFGVPMLYPPGASVAMTV